MPTYTYTAFAPDAFTFPDGGDFSLATGSSWIRGGTPRMMAIPLRSPMTTPSLAAMLRSGMMAGPRAMKLAATAGKALLFRTRVAAPSLRAASIWRRAPHSPMNSATRSTSIRSRSAACWSAISPMGHPAGQHLHGQQPVQPAGYGGHASHVR